MATPQTLPALCDRTDLCDASRIDKGDNKQVQLVRRRVHSHCSRRRCLNQAMEAHNKKLAALHRANATGISFLVESHPEAKRTIKLPSSHDVPGNEAAVAADEQTASTSEGDRRWSRHTFPCKQPSGRRDALDLRAWLHSELQNLNLNTQGDLNKEGMLEYAKTAMDLYNAAFHELTRQVSVSCTERGRLMADVWTSHSELASRIIADLRSHDDAHSAMANALHRKQKTLFDACSLLQDKCQQAGIENAALQARIAELENSVKGAERAAYGAPLTT